MGAGQSYHQKFKVYSYFNFPFYNRHIENQSFLNIRIFFVNIFTGDVPRGESPLLYGPSRKDSFPSYQSYKFPNDILV